MSNKCIVQTAKKYTSGKRPSPAFPANECCGQYKWGNNGQLYKSVADKKQICKWKVVSPSKPAQNYWQFIKHHPQLYGVPYDFNMYSTRNYDTLDNMETSAEQFKCGTVIDINLQSKVDLTLSNGKAYTLQGEEDIKEQEKYISSSDIFEWYKDSVEELDYIPLTLIPKNPIVLISTSLFNINNAFRDGVQLNILLGSKKPLNKKEIENALTGLTSMDSMGIGYDIKLANNNKYNTYGTIRSSAGSAPTSTRYGNYKLTTWELITISNSTNPNKNVKTSTIGKVDVTQMPTYPIMDAVKDESENTDTIPRYHYSGKTEVKKPNTNKPNANKPIKKCPKGKVLSASGRCVKEKKPSANKPKPDKKCPKGKVLSASGRCVKEKKPSANKPKPQKDCPKGKVRSPKGRCVKVKKPSANKPKPQKDCPKGKVRSPKGRCVKVKKPSANKPKPQKDCPKGKVRSPKGRCVKEKKPFPGRKEMSKLRPPNCFEQTTKKYTSPKRKSPPFKANLCCDTIMFGNNGELWESVPNKKGICTWKPY